MNKKIVISIIAALLVVVGVVTGVWFLRGDESLPEEPTESSTEPESTESSTEPSTEEQMYEQNRELKFDNRVTVIKNADSYIDNVEAIATSTDADIIDKYDFSNGFVLEDTDNITVGSHGFNEGILYGESTDAIITVDEKDALSTTIQQLRLDALNNYALNYYVSCDALDIPRDADCEIGVGLEDWESYFEGEPYRDPTVEEWAQLLCDTVTDTAFGSTLYFEVYLPSNDKYVAHAFILCERDRILSIKIEDTKRDNLWSYLIDLTNDSLSLVK